MKAAPDSVARRCWWCGEDELYVAYHDREWGFPVADDRRLFEKVCLEGFQSGLSWLTILRKRENFREAFANFEFDRVARFTARDIERLLDDAAIVRHRGKIESTINNAKRALRARGRVRLAGRLLLALGARRLGATGEDHARGRSRRCRLRLSPSHCRRT